MANSRRSARSDCLFFTIVTVSAILAFADDITPEEKECQNDLKLVIPSDHGWPLRAASTQASTLYLAWTSAQEPITDRDWRMLMDVAAMEAGEKPNARF